MNRADLITGAEAAALVGVRPGTIRQWVFRGHLTVTGLENVGVRGKMAYLYDPADVLSCDEERRRAAQARYEPAVSQGVLPVGADARPARPASTAAP